MIPPRYRHLLGLSYSNPRQLGQMSAGTGAANRGFLLAEAVTQGKIKANQLSPADLSAAGPQFGNVKPVGVHPTGDHGFFGALGNLGSDIWSATKGLPVGLWTAGKDIVLDAPTLFNPANVVKGFTDPFGAPPETRLKRDVLDPIKEAYQYTYAGKGAPKGSSFWDRLYEHPLGPILDVATVASLGAGGLARGGSMLSKAGKISPESRLAKMSSTVREPIPVDRALAGEGEHQVPTIAREYSQRPLRKGLQILTDKSTNIPWLGPKIENLQGKWTQRFGQKTGFSRKEAESMGNIRREVVQPLIQLFKDLDPEELQAFQLIGHRVNTPELIGQLKGAVSEGLADVAPEGQRFGDYAKIVDERLPESWANLSPRSEALAVDPTGSERLMAALSGYKERTASRIEGELDPEALAAKKNEVLTALVERYGQPAAPAATGDLSNFDIRKMNTIQGGRGGALDQASHPLESGIYTEDLVQGVDDAARDLQDIGVPNKSHPFAEGFIMPTQIGEGFKWYQPNWYSRKLLSREPGFVRGFKGRAFTPSNITYQTLFQEPFVGFRPNADPFLAGVTRPDARQFIDLLAKHERDKVEKAYSEETLNRVALKDQNGEMVKVPGNMPPDKVRAKYGEGWVAVPPVYPWHFFNKELNVADALVKMEAHGLDVSEISARLGAEAEDMALDASLAAQRSPAVLVPRDFAEYQRKLEGASRPYENPAGRAYARALNTWRSYTLAMMPRWALNTAVGSFVLAGIKGVSPAAHVTAHGLKKAGIFENEAVGVNLGGSIGLELLESGAQGHLDQAFGIKGPGKMSRGVMEKVQGIEDYFRRGSFVQALDHQSQRMMNENGAIISNLEKSKGPRTVDEYVDFIKDNPDAVNRAIQEVDRFSYNFATLGPTERRYIRQGIPFWGWYKFISSLAYRLPVEYPGRSALLAQVGFLGTRRTEEQIGLSPDWIQGAIPLGLKGGHLTYLSTMGLNPFSQIFNPMGPQGTAQGILQLGQGSPAVQAVLAGFGVDTLRGGDVPVSPQERVAPDFFGSLISLAKADEGKWPETDAATEAAGRRFLATLIRSFPQARIMERARSGGRSVYPESLPWDIRPMPTAPESRFGGSASDVLEQIIGVAPRPYNLGAAQSLMRKRVKYARTRNRRDLSKLRKNLQGP